MILSMGLAIGPVFCMWTRRLYAYINQALTWDKPLTLVSDALGELEFWGNCFKKFTVQAIWPFNPMCSISGVIFRVW